MLIGPAHTSLPIYYVSSSSDITISHRYYEK